MADIFLSYSRADRPKAQQIAESLEAEGFSVWWDKVLRAGQTYDEVTEGMLRDSRVVVVLWSEVSVKSKWVRAEATLGERTSAVVPAMIQDAERPIMFELTQTADLIGWDGDRDAANWKQFVADLTQALGSAPIDPKPAPVSGGPETPDATIENTFWTSIESSDDAADFEAYLKRYPEGHFADLAKIRIDKLGSVEDSLARSAAPATEPHSSPVSVPKPAPTPRPAAPVSRKSSGSPLPLILGGAVLLAALGIGGVMLLSGNEAGDEAERTAEAAPVSDSPFTDCDLCPDMVVIEAGRFMMGSPDDEVGRTGNESPMHAVQLSAFAIGKTEVTFDQWDACLADGGCNGYNPSDRGYGRGDQPVIGISWNDAKSYASWISGKTGKSYRLPTEAQWEYAARAGTQTPYWWGIDFSSGEMPMSQPVPTGSLRENPFGLQGMLGNAREWVEDCYMNSYADSPADGSAQRGGDCNRRILRGGAWGRDPDDHRAANRARISRDVRDRAFGFRLVTDAPAAE
ncbi:MAG: SUMF1/EgtB/PvdO family nonheme iron enzyme [Pseudomonadota bacterium]